MDNLNSRVRTIGSVLLYSHSKIFSSTCTHNEFEFYTSPDHIICACLQCYTTSIFFASITLCVIPRGSDNEKQEICLAWPYYLHLGRCCRRLGRKLSDLGRDLSDMCCRASLGQSTQALIAVN